MKELNQSEAQNVTGGQLAYAMLLLATASELYDFGRGFSDAW